MVGSGWGSRGQGWVGLSGRGGDGEDSRWAWLRDDVGVAVVKGWI